jgi:hypothetical protein
LRDRAHDTAARRTRVPRRKPKGGEATLGEARTSTRVDRIDDGVVHGVAEYEARGRRSTHAFAMHVFADQAELDAALEEGGLAFERWLDRKRGWFVARSAAARP